jgi:hypothetical protein
MSRARESTLTHMQRLAATAAIVTTAACSGKCGSSTTTGYAVVDPMPRPSRTTGVASTIVASVKHAADGGPQLELEIADPTMPGVTYVAASPTPRDAGDAGVGYSAIGAVVVSATRTATGMKFVMQPDPGRAAFYLRIDVDGPDGPGTVQASVSWGTSLADAHEELVVVMDDR